jgi:hypothetical protein
MAKKYYLIQTQSAFKIQYAVATETDPQNGHLQALVDDGTLHEVSQNFLGEKIVGMQELTQDELFAKIAEQFPEIEDAPHNMKISLINEIDQPDTEMLTDEESQSI